MMGASPEARSRGGAQPRKPKVTKEVKSAYTILGPLRRTWPPSQNLAPFAEPGPLRSHPGSAGVRPPLRQTRRLITSCQGWRTAFDGLTSHRAAGEGPRRASSSPRQVGGAREGEGAVGPYSRMRSDRDAVGWPEIADVPLVVGVLGLAGEAVLQTARPSHCCPRLQVIDAGVGAAAAAAAGAVGSARCYPGVSLVPTMKAAVVHRPRGEGVAGERKGTAGFGRGGEEVSQARDEAAP